MIQMFTFAPLLILFKKKSVDLVIHFEFLNYTFF